MHVTGAGPLDPPSAWRIPRQRGYPRDIRQQKSVGISAGQINPRIFTHTFVFSMTFWQLNHVPRWKGGLAMTLTSNCWEIWHNLSIKHFIWLWQSFKLNTYAYYKGGGTGDITKQTMCTNTPAEILTLSTHLENTHKIRECSFVLQTDET